MTVKIDSKIVKYAVLSKVLRSEAIAATDWLAMIAIPALICAVALVVFSQRLGDEKMLAGK